MTTTPPARIHTWINGRLWRCLLSRREIARILLFTPSAYVMWAEQEA